MNLLRRNNEKVPELSNSRAAARVIDLYFRTLNIASEIPDKVGDAIGFGHKVVSAATTVQFGRTK